tara:strand:- start:662 stop:916 length:255 start_codon:yes stop_codon:yes gene_type:complete
MWKPVAFELKNSRADGCSGQLFPGMGLRIFCALPGGEPPLWPCGRRPTGPHQHNGESPRNKAEQIHSKSSNSGTKILDRYWLQI